MKNQISPAVVMRIAHMLHKSRTAGRLLAMNVDHRPVLNSWSNALKHAWYLMRLKNALRTGILTFSFYKKDGTIREAKGTTHHLLVPQDKRPKGIFEPGHTIATISFFDLDKQEWRSFNIENFIGFVTIWELKESDKRK